MSAPTFLAGHEPTADEMQFLLPLFAMATNDQGVTSSTTMVDSTYLQLSVLANATYEWHALLLFDAPTGNQFKNQFAGPSGYKMYWASNNTGSGTITAATFNVEKRIETDFAQCPATFGAGTIQAVRPSGLLITSSTAGVFKMQFAQVTAGGTTTLRTGSFLVARRVA